MRYSCKDGLFTEESLYHKNRITEESLWFVYEFEILATRFLGESLQINLKNDMRSLLVLISKYKSLWTDYKWI